MAYQILDLNGTSHTITPLQASRTAQEGRLQTLSITIPIGQLEAITDPIALVIGNCKASITSIDKDSTTAQIIAESVNPGLSYTRINPLSQANTLSDYLNSITSQVQGQNTYLGTLNLSANPLTAELGISSVFGLLSQVCECYGKTIFHTTDSQKDQFIIADPPASFEDTLPVFSVVQDQRKEQYTKAIITKTAGMNRYAEAVYDPTRQGNQITTEGIPYLLGQYSPISSNSYSSLCNGQQFSIAQLRELGEAFSLSCPADQQQTAQAWTPPDVPALAFAPAYKSAFDVYSWEKTYSQRITESGICDNATTPETRQYIGAGYSSETNSSRQLESKTTGIYGSVGNNSNIYTRTTWTNGQIQRQTVATTTEPNLAQKQIEGYAKEVDQTSTTTNYPDTTETSGSTSTTGAEVTWDYTPTPTVFPWNHLARDITATAYTDITEPGSVNTVTDSGYWGHDVKQGGTSIGYISGTRDTTEVNTASPTIIKKLTGLSFSPAKLSADFDPSAIPSIFPNASAWQFSQSSYSFGDPTVPSTNTNTKMNGIGIVGQYTYQQGMASYPYELQPDTKITAITAKWLAGEKVKAYYKDTDFDISLLPEVTNSRIPIHLQIAESSQNTFSTEKQSSPDPKTYVLTGTVWDKKSEALLAVPGVLFNQKQGVLTTARTPYSPSLFNLLGKGITLTVNGQTIQGQLVYINADLLNEVAEIELKTA